MSDDYERIISNSKEIVKTIQKTELQQLTESNRQLREENEQVKAQLNLIKKHPAKCNDGLPEIVDFVEMEKIEQERNQLREELEQAKQDPSRSVRRKRRDYLAFRL